MPIVSVGDELLLNSKEVLEKFTKPPKSYTEDTLLKAMEIAGNDSLDKDIEVERKGPGTPATRAGVIENLIYKGFVERDKKNLISTEKGRLKVIDSFAYTISTKQVRITNSGILEIGNGTPKKKEFYEQYLIQTGRKFCGSRYFGKHFEGD